MSPPVIILSLLFSDLRPLKFFKTARGLTRQPHGRTHARARARGPTMGLYCSAQSGFNCAQIAGFIQGDSFSCEDEADARGGWGENGRALLWEAGCVWESPAPGRKRNQEWICVRLRLVF